MATATLATTLAQRAVDCPPALRLLDCLTALTALSRLFTGRDETDAPLAAAVARAVPRIFATCAQVGNEYPALATLGGLACTDETRAAILALPRIIPQVVEAVKSSDGMTRSPALWLLRRLSFFVPAKLPLANTPGFPALIAKVGFQDPQYEVDCTTILANCCIDDETALAFLNVPDLLPLYHRLAREAETFDKTCNSLTGIKNLATHPVCARAMFQTPGLVETVLALTRRRADQPAYEEHGMSALANFTSAPANAPAIVMSPLNIVPTAVDVLRHGAHPESRDAALVLIHNLSLSSSEETRVALFRTPGVVESALWIASASGSGSEASRRVVAQ